MTGTRVTLRPAEAADIDALLRIETDAFPGDRLERRHFRHAIRSPSITMLVAREAGEVCGYVLTEFRRGARVGRISSLAVAQQQVGRGLGRRLLDAAEADARARGCDRVRLEVRADNGRAAGLYVARGYERIGRVDDVYEDGEAAERFEKALDVTASRRARPAPRA